ncbi:MAG: hypothetical protein PHG54_09975 [Smithellaceae bacterium]|nr:hypothetical protein [Smithellaceae bacterium]NLX50998.1 hypothetical protein [Deltaproteobacteria bacterium]
MDDTVLEKSIREEAARLIAALREKEAAAIRTLEEEHAARLEQFRRQEAKEAEARREQELAKLENRAVLERKKLRLRSLERFLGDMVAGTVRDVQRTAAYKTFLLASVRNAAKRISGEAQIRVKPEDLVWQDEILAAAGDRTASVAADPGIAWGGCLVRDAAGGRIFNVTLERIYFRKSALLRRKAMQLLADHARGKAPGTTPRQKVEA